MSKVSVKRRSFKIRAKRKRKKKVKILKERYLVAKSKEERNKIIEKIQKIAPYYPIKEISKEGKEE